MRRKHWLAAFGLAAALITVPLPRSQVDAGLGLASRPAGPTHADSLLLTPSPAAVELTVGASTSTATSTGEMARRLEELDADTAA